MGLNDDPRYNFLRIGGVYPFRSDIRVERKISDYTSVFEYDELLEIDQ